MKKPDDKARLKHMLDAALDAKKFLGKATFEELQRDRKLGNATYVFDKDWEELSKLTKAQILDEGLQRDRVIHRKGWHQRIRHLLS